MTSLEQQTKYRKLFIQEYHPTRFQDYIVGRKTIGILNDLLQANQLNLILYGAASTGKTTLLNTIIQEYYADCTATTITQQDQKDNVMHINNLHEQGIQFYRTDVKTFCQTRSTIPGKKKLLIIDDIDLIIEQGQHIFRTCMDKHHNNVFFLVSCTAIQKVIEPIQSRLNIIQLPAHFFPEELAALSTHIATREGIQITQEAAALLHTIINGSVQMLVQYMEKFYVLGREITPEVVNELRSNISFTVLDQYIVRLRSGSGTDTNPTKYIYEELYDKGYSVIDILDSLFIYIKATATLSEPEKYAVIELLCKYIAIFNTVHEHEIELAFFTAELQDTLLSMGGHAAAATTNNK